MAQLCGMSLEWLRKRRRAGDGPPFIKNGRSVRYPSDRYLDWYHSLSGLERPPHHTIENQSGSAHVRVVKAFLAGEITEPEAYQRHERISAGIDPNDPDPPLAKLKRAIDDALAHKQLTPQQVEAAYQLIPQLDPA